MLRIMEARIIWSEVEYVCFVIIFLDDRVFAFAGCNATLEWILWNGTGTVTARVWNPRGIKIAWVEDTYCEELKGYFVRCDIQKYGEVKMLYVALINVTEANSGVYMSEIKYGFVDRKNITKELILIDKLQVRKPTKIIRGEPMNISCVLPGKLERVNYRWKLNGTDFNSTGFVIANASTLMFESLWTVDKSNIFSCEVCQENRSCVTSETFSLDPYYGPYNVDLDVKENHIFLNENENFTVKCSADCYPDCNFWWEGCINSDNEELIIRDFDSSKAGQYICNARNNETDMRNKSYPIHLHLAEVFFTVTSSPEQNEEFLRMGLVIAVVFLVIVGFLILKKKRCYNSIQLGSHISYHPCVEQVNKEAREELRTIEKQNQPLPIPQKQENACRRAQRSHYPNIYRKSKSLNQLDDCTKDIWNPGRQSLSLQTLIARCTNSDGSEGIVYGSEKGVWLSMKGTATRICLVETHSNDRKVKKGSNVDQCASAESQGTNKSSHGSLGLETQYDPYYSIDETDVLVYDYARVTEPNSKVQENIGSSNKGNYEYDYAILPGP